MLKVHPDAEAKLHLLSEKRGKEDSRTTFVQVVPSNNGHVFCAATDGKAVAVVEMSGQADGVYGINGSSFGVKREEKMVVIECSPGETSSRTSFIKGEKKNERALTGSPYKTQDVMPVIEEDRYCIVTIDAKRLLDVAKAMDAGDSEGEFPLTMIIKVADSKFTSREIGEILDEARPDRDAVANLCEEISWSNSSQYGSIGHRCSGYLASLYYDEGKMMVWMGYSRISSAIAAAGPFEPSKPRSPHDVADALLADYDEQRVARMAATVDSSEPIALVSNAGGRKAVGCIKQANSVRSSKDQLKRYTQIRDQFVEAADKSYETPF